MKKNNTRIIPQRLLHLPNVAVKPLALAMGI